MPAPSMTIESNEPTETSPTLRVQGTIKEKTMTDDIRNGRILVSEGLHLINRDTCEDGMPAEDVVLAQIGNRPRVRRMSALQLQQAVDMGYITVIDREDLADGALACLGSDEEGLPVVVRHDHDVRSVAKPTIESLRADGTILRASEIERVGACRSPRTRHAVDHHATV